MPLWGLCFLVILAETNRTPFDLPEAEAELVAGFNVEYSSLLFAFFFLAEYSAMGFFATLLVTLFFGGYSLVPLGWGVDGDRPISHSDSHFNVKMETILFLYLRMVNCDENSVCVRPPKSV